MYRPLAEKTPEAMLNIWLIMLGTTASCIRLKSVEFVYRHGSWELEDIDLIHLKFGVIEPIICVDLYHTVSILVMFPVSNNGNKG